MDKEPQFSFWEPLMPVEEGDRVMQCLIIREWLETVERRTAEERGRDGAVGEVAPAASFQVRARGRGEDP